ncbi:hypothetical protein [Sporosarcina sp. E16_8]|nr:hypothetical protein [Sporosarcina sp. E16_8]
MFNFFQELRSKGRSVSEARKDQLDLMKQQLNEVPGIVNEQ